MKLSNRDEFIKKAVKIHGDKYVYKDIIYINSRSKIDILCTEHGIFKQTPNSHLNGSGCIDCAGLKKKTSQEFISDAIKIHGDKYDYNKVLYSNTHTNVTIICKKHGEFLQTPHIHLVGSGCPLCFGTSNMTLTKEEFLEKCKTIHGDKYDYSNVNYLNNNTKVDIICREHGVFRQIPYSHLKKQGCPSCSNRKRLTKEQFVEKCKKFHGDRYDYSIVNYVNNNTKVEIICKKHGVFKQRPLNHLNLKKGCPKCSKSKGETIVENFLIENNYSYKSQFTFNDLKNINLLKFDFGVIDNEKILFLIEFNGIQHYENRKPFYKNEKEFETSKNRDLLKIKYCEDNGIKLYIIRYDDDIKEKFDMIKMDYRYD